jgi:hypothetical protein
MQDEIYYEDLAFAKSVLAAKICYAMRRKFTFSQVKAILGKGTIEIYKILAGKYSPLTTNELEEMLEKIEAAIEKKKRAA